jgi:amidase
MDLTYATATELITALRHRTISSRELLEHQLGRIEQGNARLNAVVGLDVDRAQAAAKLADDETASGRASGPLHGLPMTVRMCGKPQDWSPRPGSPR